MRFELKPINVLIGANGAGKSNIVDIFRLLESFKNNNLQFYIGKSGGANSILQNGAEVTHQMGTRFGFEIDNVFSWYGVQLAEAPIDTLIFADEYFESTHQLQKLGTGHKEINP
jgi:predicted ATPase